MSYRLIIDFWFHEIEPSYWFKKDSSFDQKIRERFSEIYRAATKSELYDWRSSALGCLAEVIVLDQFSRNLFRNSPQAFSYDSLALCLSQSAIEKKMDKELNAQQKSFLYMPFMHSESLKIHEQALELFAAEGLENNLAFEIKHRDIIVKFGRYPHRNKVMNRNSTEEELNFLREPGSSF